MIFTLERVTDPDIEPVTLAEMKTHLRCFDDISDEDSAITALIVGAREWVEDFTGRALIDQAWRLTINQQANSTSDFVGGVTPGTGYYCEAFQWQRQGEILLRKSPVLAVTAFASVDAAGAETAIASDSYELREADSKWPRIVGLNGATWTAGVLRITYRAGFADRTGSPQESAAVVPERFKQAMKLWVEAMYDRDEKMMSLLLDTAERLIKSERCDLSLA